MANRRLRLSGRGPIRDAAAIYCWSHAANGFDLKSVPGRTDDLRHLTFPQLVGYSPRTVSKHAYQLAATTPLRSQSGHAEHAGQPSPPELATAILPHDAIMASVISIGIAGRRSDRDRSLAAQASLREPFGRSLPRQRQHSRSKSTASIEASNQCHLAPCRKLLQANTSTHRYS